MSNLAPGGLGGTLGQIAEEARLRRLQAAIPGIPDDFTSWSDEERARWYREHSGTPAPTSDPGLGLGLTAIGQFATGNTGPIETPDRPYATQPAALFDKAEEERKRREAAQMQTLMGIGLGGGGPAPIPAPWLPRAGR